MKKRLIEPIAVKYAGSILRRAFGRDVDFFGIHLLRGGLFNASYKVGLRGRAPVVLRVAPPAGKPLLDYEKSLLKREVFFLPLLCARGVPVPRVLFQDFSAAILPRDYVILDYRTGHNAFLRWESLTPAEQEEVSAQWGELAANIHSITNPEGWFGPPSPMRRQKSWSAFIGFYVRSLWKDLQKNPRLRREATEDLRIIARAMAPTLDKIKTPRLIHGDLSLRNILITKENGHCRITTVLDWDRALWGDPWFEWILHGLDLKPAFWKRYGTCASESPDARRRLLLYKACGCLHAALEEEIHFGKTAEALQMMRYYKDNATALVGLL